MDNMSAELHIKYKEAKNNYDEAVSELDKIREEYLEHTYSNPYWENLIPKYDKLMKEAKNKVDQSFSKLDEVEEEILKIIPQFITTKSLIK